MKNSYETISKILIKRNEYLIKVALFFSGLLAFINLNAQNDYYLTPPDLSKKCLDHGPTYYTTKILYSYEHMNTESAIVCKIPINSELIVTNSFFGENGWWQVCFEGKTGWVNKKYLSINKPESQNLKYNEKESLYNTPTDFDDANVGFNPFYAITTSKINLRAAPSSSGSVIRILPISASLYVFSNSTVNGYYKVIDQSTGIVGWANIGFLKWNGDISITTDGSNFKSTGSTSNINAEVIVNNKSNYKITLIVNGTTFYIQPNSHLSFTVAAGKSSYVATAPGVSPASGYQVFNSYQEYKWDFWVE